MEQTREVQWDPPQADISRKGFFLVMGILLLISSGLRFYNLGTWPLHGDELFTIRDAKNLHFGFLSTYRGYPLAYMIVKIFMLMGMDSVIALRLPFAIFGIAGVLVTYWLARHFVSSKAAAFGAFLLSIHHAHLFMSQEIRFYGMVYFFSALFLGFFWRALHSNEKRWAFLAGVSLSCAILSQNIALILLLNSVIFLVVSKFRGFTFTGMTWKNAYALAVPLIVMITFMTLISAQSKTPFVVSFIYFTLSGVMSGHSVQSTNSTTHWMVFGLKQFVLSLVWWMTPVMVGVGVLGALDQKKERFKAYTFNLVYSVMGVLVLLMISLKAQSFPRYLTPVLPAIVMLWCQATQIFLVSFNRKWLMQLGFAFVVLLPLFVYTLSYLRDGDRLPWFPVAEYLQENVKNGDLLVVRYGRVLKHIQPELNPVEPSDSQALNRNGRNVWVVMPISFGDFPPGAYDKQELKEWLAKHAHLVKEYGVRRYDGQQNSLRIYYAPKEIHSHL